MEKMSRENAYEIEFAHGTLERCVEMLLEYQSRGESVYIDYRGHRLYSCDVTMDSAFKEVTGKTKAESDEIVAERRRESKERESRELAEARKKIPTWVEMGSAYIYPERVEEWTRCVDIRANDLYHGTEIDLALNLMQKLESGASIEEVKDIFTGQSVRSANFVRMVRSIMLRFAKRGIEFYEGTAEKELTDEEKRIIEDMKKENARLDEIHRNESGENAPAQINTGEDITAVLD